MTVLIYMGHPAQFHFFKFIIEALHRNFFTVVLLIKTKDKLEELVKDRGWEYQNIQPVPRKPTAISVFGAMLRRSWQLCKITRSYNVDLLLGTDASVAHAAFVCGRKSLTVVEDDYRVIRQLAWLTFPFTTAIVAPHCCDVGRWNYKKTGYEGYMKLAYLHPDYFTPSEVVLRSFCDATEFVLIRLVSLSAFHDKGKGGLTLGVLKNVIIQLSQLKMKVYISSENALPDELNSYRLCVPASALHHLLAGARLLVSDSQSMSVEAAMLGVPSVRFSDFAGKISVLEELEHRYRLTFGVSASHPLRLYELIGQLLADTSAIEIFKARRKKMLNDKIDVTAFMVKLIQQLCVK